MVFLHFNDNLSAFLNKLFNQIKVKNLRSFHFHFILFFNILKIKIYPKFSQNHSKKKKKKKLIQLIMIITELLSIFVVFNY